MWHLIFLFILLVILLIVLYPFFVKFDVRFNLLKLKGSLTIKLFNFVKIDFRLRIKNGYIYINHKNKIRKEKITNNNFNVVFFMNLISQIYFREQFLTLDMKSNFGYVNDSCITAVGCGYIDVLTKSILSKLKNNKKSSHIFVNNEPRYNEDIFNVRFINEIRISLADILYALIYALLNSWGKYEKGRKRKTKKQQNRVSN